MFLRKNEMIAAGLLLQTAALNFLWKPKMRKGEMEELKSKFKFFVSELGRLEKE